MILLTYIYWIHYSIHYKWFQFFYWPVLKNINISSSLLHLLCETGLKKLNVVYMKHMKNDDDKNKMEMINLTAVHKQMLFTFHQLDM